MQGENDLLKQLPGGCNGWWEFSELSTEQQKQARELWPEIGRHGRGSEAYKYAVANFDGRVVARQLKEYLR